MQVCWQTPNLSDIKWRSTFEMGAARLRSYTKITPKWLFLYVSRSHTRYGFRADARAFRFSVNVIKNETVVPGRQNVIVRWGYITVNVQLTNLNFLVVVHSTCHLCLWLMRCSVTTRSLYIFIYLFCTPCQCKLLWIQFFCCDLGPVYMEVGDPR